MGPVYSHPWDSVPKLLGELPVGAMSQSCRGQSLTSRQLVPQQTSDRHEQPISHRHWQYSCGGSLFPHYDLQGVYKVRIGTHSVWNTPLTLSWLLLRPRADSVLCVGISHSQCELSNGSLPFPIPHNLKSRTPDFQSSRTQGRAAIDSSSSIAQSSSTLFSFEVNVDKKQPNLRSYCACPSALLSLSLVLYSGGSPPQGQTPLSHGWHIRYLHRSS